MSGLENERRQGAHCGSVLHTLNNGFDPNARLSRKENMEAAVILGESDILLKLFAIKKYI